MMYKALLLGLVTSTAAAAQTLRGSNASVDLMYSTAHQRDLQFFRTPQDIYNAAMAGSLELISITEDLEVDKTGWPFVLPNTHRFADSLAAQYHAACGERLVVTSGARPLDEQPRNASPKSVHPTGMAVDFRKPKTPACLDWLRKSLIQLEDAGVIEATEERHPPHFHVAVLRQRPERHIQMAAGDVALAPGKATTPAKAPAPAPAPAQAKAATPVKAVSAKATTPAKHRVKAKKSATKKPAAKKPAER
jgi:hypothetical protein